MKALTQKYKRRNWELCKNETEPSRWDSIYASINKFGLISVNRVCFVGLGSPGCVQIYFDRSAETIGITPARRGSPDSFVIKRRGKHNGRTISAYRLIREFGIYIPHTLLFPRAHISSDGLLILDLRDTRPVNRKHRY